MNKTMAVIRREFISRVRTKGFVISTILLPVLLVVLFAVQIALMSSGKDTTTRIALVDGSAQQIGDRIRTALDAETMGSGADSKPRYAVTVFAAGDDAAAQRDKLIAKVGVDDAGGETWDGVMMVDRSTLQDGKISYYGESVGSMTAMQELRSSLSKVLASIRLSASGIDPAMVAQSMRPAQLKTVQVSEGKTTGKSGMATFAVAYGMGYILFLAILIYGQQTMTSVIEEKTSRVMEVLASSLTPFQMLLGKVLGVGAAGLLQMLIWGGSVLLLTSQAAHLAGLVGIDPDAAAKLAMPVMSGDLLVVFLLYFVLGFLLYGALYAAIGSMCNTIQETQQYASAVTMIILVGFFATFSMINNPTGELAKILSFVPFVSPFTMPVRWSVAAVPWPQLLLSLALALGALLACVWLAARIYRTGILMYGKKPGFKELWRWMRAD